MIRGELIWMDQKTGERRDQTWMEMEKNDQMRVGKEESEKL